MKNSYLGLIVALVMVAVIGAGFSWWLLPGWHHYEMMEEESMDHHHAMMGHHSHEHDFDLSGAEAQGEYLAMRDMISGDQREHGNYACCLETPCTYCLEKSPKHGEGSACTCLEDIVNGVHPCGECIGEILEGHGNKLLTQYFAPAIAEEVGEKYFDVIQQIIDDKYPDIKG